MSQTNYYKWVPCPECDGTCKVFVLQKGAGFSSMEHCRNCFLGKVQVRMTTEEVLAALEKIKQDVLKAG